MAPDGPVSEVQVARIGSFFDKELLPFNRDRWQADLELIVKAVNNHDAMVKVLEALRDDPAVPPWIQFLAGSVIPASVGGSLDPK